MAFEYEREMVEPAVQWLRGQGLRVKREFPTPWGICDLVGCSLNRNKVRTRLRLRQTKPIRSQLRVHLLSLIPEKGQGSVGVDDLHRVFDPYLDRERIERELMRLQKDRFIQPAGHDTFDKINGWMPLHKRLIAVELKLSRIDDALCQAINNLGFAGESYVGLPLDVATRLVKGRRKADFVERGIGVLAVGADCCRVVLRAARQGRNEERTTQTYAVERFWLPHLKGSEA
jgi:hypothetical protein